MQIFLHFHFHPVKSITTGEGGMFVTNKKDLIEKQDCYEIME